MNREILALAVPALGALVAEPLFVLVDSAIVGHLGTGPLAGLTVASTLLLTVVGLCIFLAYATTAAVARRLGAGDRAGAVTLGVDGMWLALILGVVLAIVGLALAPWAVRAMGASADVAPYAVAYLRTSLLGLPGMLIVLAATGALRGLQDTRSTLVVAAIGAGVNAALNATLVYAAGMGIAGSGLGTAISQWGMAVALIVIVVRGSRGQGVRLRPSFSGIVAGARTGVPLFIRTVSLRIAILITVAVAGSLGDVELAAHQIVNSLWGLTAYALDALAIASQALIGKAIGAGDRAEILAVRVITTRWGVWGGVVLGVVMAAISVPVTALFTSDAAVQQTATWALLVAACCMPIAGYVFVLDGVLMGASEGRYLAVAGMMTLLVYLPCAGAVWLWASGPAGLAWLWASFGGAFMAARGFANGHRVHSAGWPMR